MNGYINKKRTVSICPNHKDGQIDANDIARFPCADVVPKSEVEIWKETANKCEEAYEAWHRTAELNAQRIIELEAELSKAKSEVAREILELYKDFCDADFEERLSELKKKYMEGKK